MGNLKVQSNWEGKPDGVSQGKSLETKEASMESNFGPYMVSCEKLNISFKCWTREGILAYVNAIIEKGGWPSVTKVAA